MQAVNLITSLTGTATSVPFPVGVGKISVFSKGTIAGSETITLQVKDDTGSWGDVTDDLGTTVQLTASVNAIRVLGPGLFRVNKISTASSAGAFYYGES